MSASVSPIARAVCHGWLAGEHADRGERDRGDRHLQPAGTEYRAAHPPQARGLELESDQEEHHDDAELGDVHDVFAFLPDQAEAERADHHARGEIAEDGARGRASSRSGPR